MYRAQPGQTKRLAALIAHRADRNFLVAALAAEPLAQEPSALDPAAPGFDPTDIPSSIGEALRKYLDQPRLERRRVRIQGLLEGLAYARGDGVADDLWLAFAAALGYDASIEDSPRCATARRRTTCCRPPPPATPPSRGCSTKRSTTNSSPPGPHRRLTNGRSLPPFTNSPTSSAGAARRRT